MTETLPLITAELTRQKLFAALPMTRRGGNFNYGIAQLARNGVVLGRGGVLHLAKPLPGEAG